MSQRKRELSYKTLVPALASHLVEPWAGPPGGITCPVTLPVCLPFPREQPRGPEAGFFLKSCYKPQSERRENVKSGRIRMRRRDKEIENENKRKREMGEGEFAGEQEQGCQTSSSEEEANPQNILFRQINQLPPVN